MTHGAAGTALLVRLTDAGGGSGTWTVSLQPQSASAGAELVLPGTVTIAPGGAAELPIRVQAAADAPRGDDYGFVVLTKDGVTRRIPYAYFVTRPALASLTPIPISGSRRVRPSARRVSRSTAGPPRRSGPPPSYTGPPMREDGAETLYVLHVNTAVVERRRRRREDSARRTRRPLVPRLAG